MPESDDESISTAKELFELSADLAAGAALGSIELLKLAPTLVAGSVIGFMEVASDIVLAFLPKKPRN